MLYVVATCTVKNGREQEFETIVKRMIEGTRAEPKFIAYDCGKLEGKERVYVITETWANRADQEEHFALPHIQQNIPALIETLDDELDIQFIHGI